MLIFVLHEQDAYAYAVGAWSLWCTSLVWLLCARQSFEVHVMSLARSSAGQLNRFWSVQVMILAMILATMLAMMSYSNRVE